MRLIDADALIEKLKIIREAELQIYGIGHWNFVGKCINEVEEMPSAQPDELAELNCSMNYEGGYHEGYEQGYKDGQSSRPERKLQWG